MPRDRIDGSFRHRSRSREREIIIDYERRGSRRGARDDVADYDREKDRFNFDARRVPSETDRRRPRTRSRSPRDRTRKPEPDFGMAARLAGRPRDRERALNAGRFDSNGRFRPEPDERRGANEPERQEVKPQVPKVKVNRVPGMPAAVYTYRMYMRGGMRHIRWTILTLVFFAVDDLLCEPGRKSRGERIVVIVRGPPGSGKTYVSKLIKV